MLLNLPGWTVDRAEETAHDLLLAVTPPPHLERSPACPHCHHGDYYGHGSQARRIADLPIRAKRVSLLFDQPRLRCRYCGRTFSPSFADLDEQHNMTVRLREYIVAQAGPRPFLHVAEEVGVSEGTIRNVVAAAEASRPQPETPRVLGIDELYLQRRHRCILTNIEAGTVLDLLSGRTYRQLLAHISAMPDRQRVDLVTIDMHRPYLDVARATLPRATVIVDKYHVLAMANRAVDRLRIALRQTMPDRTARTLMRSRFLLLKRPVDLSGAERLSLETWLDQLPALRRVYAAKEGFFAVYKTARTAKDAETQLDAWRGSLDPQTERAFRELVTALTNWQPQILNYFDHRYTNAATEALNGIAKLLNKLGRGYSFRSIRAKLLFTAGVRQHRRPIFARRGWQDERMTSLMTAEAPETAIDLGADLSTILRQLKSGRL